MSASVSELPVAGTETTPASQSPPAPGIAHIAAALSCAQGEMGSAHKGSINPHFKSQYADLASVINAVREPFARHGIAYVQQPSVAAGRVVVDTVLMHKSGETMTCSLSAKVPDESPQKIGSAITYLRRYGLMAMAGIAPGDDDGEAAMGRNAPPAKPAPKRKPTSAKQLEKEIAACMNRRALSDDSLVADIRASDASQHLQALYKARWAELDSLKNGESK